VVTLSAGRVVRDGPGPEVLADPALEELGVAPPTAVRLARGAASAGLGATARSRLAEVLGA
jgi:hypothetical protein